MKKRVYGLLMGVLATLQCCLIVYAADDELNFTISANRSDETESLDVGSPVYMNVPSTWNVTIPKKLTLSKSTGSCSYEVSCVGDIGYQEIIEVVPQSTFELSDSSAISIAANVTQEKTQFVRNDRTPNTNQVVLGEKIVGTVSANSVLPGDWSGSFNFNISSQTGSNVTLTADNADDLGISFTGDVIIPESYVKDGVICTIVGIADGLFVPSGTNVPFATVNPDNAITSISFPSTITNLGNYTFTYCTNLTSVKLSENISEIGMAVFAGCTGLSNITLPDNIDSIGIGAFVQCTNLVNVEIPNSVKSIGIGAFQDCVRLNSVNVPKDVTVIDDNLFCGCSNLSSISIAGDVKSVGEDAFMSCGNLKTIQLPESVTTISTGAFSNCSSLQVINIPSAVSSIGAEAFYGCTSLTSISIPNKVSVINSATFEKCTNLKTVALPNTITDIKSKAFCGCSAADITIPASVTFISDDAFNEVKHVTNNSSYTVNKPWGALSYN